MNLHPRSLPSRQPRRQRGQAAVEYGIVLALTTIALITAVADPSVIDQLIAAVKSFFKAFSFALSMPAQHGV